MTKEEFAAKHGFDTPEKLARAHLSVVPCPCQYEHCDKWQFEHDAFAAQILAHEQENALNASTHDWVESENGQVRMCRVCGMVLKRTGDRWFRVHFDMATSDILLCEGAK
jgi:hypothetical protein